jgi:hypothetical protein
VVKHVLLASLGALAFACSSSESAAPAREAGRALDARHLVARASLDLRGVRPSEAELARVEADPAAALDVASGFVDDARFERRVRDWFAQVFRTRIDHYALTATDLGLPADDDLALQASIAEEPLRLVSHIATERLPWTELVTADYSFADERLARAFPVDYRAAATGWQKVHYTDGRPHAGVLSMNAFYWRFPSNGVSYGRGRANALSRALLCESFLDRPVDFPRSIDLSDDAAVAEAVRTNEACVNCHASLDPLASHLLGFQYAVESPGEMRIYHPERERVWVTATGVGPGYFGLPSERLGDLGQHVAADGRFVSCAVRTVYEAMLGRPSARDDDGALAAHREAFLEGGLRLAPLVRSVLRDPAYAGRAAESAFGGTPAPVTRKLVGPEILSAQIEELTGYRMALAGADALALAGGGLRALAGGADGATGHAPAPGVTVPLLLAQERLAEAAATSLVLAEAPRPGRLGPLLDGVDLMLSIDDPAYDPAARALVVALHRALFGARVAPDGPEAEGALELLADLSVVEPDMPLAWAGLLAALLRDPELVSY